LDFAVRNGRKKLFESSSSHRRTNSSTWCSKKNDVEMYRRKHYQSQFGIDTWIDRLGEFTFKTKSIPLSFQEAEEIISKHSEKIYHSGELLSDLESRIDDILKKDFPNGSFIKLNTRSPKDVPVYDFENSKIQKLIVDEISKWRNPNSNEETIAFVMATNKSMKLMEGKDAIELILKSSRIYEDLCKMVAFGE